jgi:hypothetical protein
MKYILDNIDDGQISVMTIFLFVKRSAIRLYLQYCRPFQFKFPTNTQFEVNEGGKGAVLDIGMQSYC